jgi:hypothetical protein
MVRHLVIGFNHVYVFLFCFRAKHFETEKKNIPQQTHPHKQEHWSFIMGRAAAAAAINTVCGHTVVEAAAAVRSSTRNQQVPLETQEGQPSPGVQSGGPASGGAQSGDLAPSASANVNASVEEVGSVVSGEEGAGGGKVDRASLEAFGAVVGVQLRRIVRTRVCCSPTELNEKTSTFVSAASGRASRASDQTLVKSPDITFEALVIKLVQVGDSTNHGSGKNKKSIISQSACHVSVCTLFA